VVGGLAGGGIEVVHRGAFHRELDAGVSSRKVAVGPELFAADGVAGGIAEDDVRRETLVFRAEGVADPGAHDGAAGEDFAGEEHVERFEVVVVLGVHATDEGEVVDDAGGVGEHLGDVHAGLPVFFEGEGAGKERVDVVRLVNLDPARQGLARVFQKSRFGVEQVHLAGAAVLDELDNRFGFAGEVLAVNEARQGERAEAESGALEELPTSEW
jgi:hypothetical protein